ncbi:MAG: SpoIIE family protein phosphatase [Tepidisphaeraceae bacterium]
MGIRTKLILSTCIPLLAIYVGVLVWDYYVSSAQALRYVKQLVTQRAKADGAVVNSRFAVVQESTDRIAYFLAHRTGGPFTGLAGVLGGGLRQMPWADAVWVRYEDETPGVRGNTVVAIKRTERNDRNGPPERGGPPNDRGGPPDRGPGSDGGGPQRIRVSDEFRPDPDAIRKIADTVKKDGKAVWLDPADVGELGLGPVCVFASPIYPSDETKPAGDAKLLGVICTAVPTNVLRYLREEVPLPPGQRRFLQPPGTANATTNPADNEPHSLADGGYLLVDGKGKILSRPDGKMLGSPLAVGPDDDELRDAIKEALHGSSESLVAGGLNQTLGADAPKSRYVLAMQQLATTGWLYVTAGAEAELLGPVQERLINRAVFLLGSLLVVVAIVMIVLTRFCRPIEKMAERVHQIAAGDLNTAPVKVVANDEIGQLAKGFNDMTGRLRHHVQELTAQSAEREKVESELRIARQIQSDLLPRTFPPFPDRQEFGLHAVNIPARHIAGDFFDFFFIDQDRLIVVIADVSGKGVPAALMMAVTRTMVRNLAQAGIQPREIVERINRMLVEDTTPGLFVTMLLGQYEPATGVFTYVNAGHPPAVCVCDGKASLCCPPTGPLLGVVSDGSLGPYEQKCYDVPPASTVLLYTDGVTEAHDQTNVLFGDGRLLASAAANGLLEPPEFCEAIVSAVMAHQHQNAADDLTLVALKRR